MSEKSEAIEDLAVRNKIRTPLDPLLHILARDYVDDNDLTDRLHKLFQVWPFDRNLIRKTDLKHSHLDIYTSYIYIYI